MLKLSDSELANLRLACWNAVVARADMAVQLGGGTPEKERMRRVAENLVLWCLEGRPPDGTDS